MEDEIEGPEDLPQDTECSDELEDPRQAERDAPLPAEVIALTGVMKLSKDLAAAVKLFNPKEVRYLVDTYYSFQEARIRVGNQERALEESGEPHEVLKWLRVNGCYLEAQIAAALASYAQEQRLCRWAMSNKGIAHIIACGLFANLDLRRAHTASHIWRFCGLDPSSVWLGKDKARVLVNKHIEAGLGGLFLVAAVAKDINRKAEFLLRDCEKNAKFAKRKQWNNEDLRKAAALCPYNRSMKVLCWKIGSSFNMLRDKNNKLPDDKKSFYGRMLNIRHAEMSALNATGGMKGKADAALASERYTDAATIKTLKTGMMPDGWVFGTAKRIVVKTFLFHYYQRGRELLNLPWVKPYSIAHKDHADFIEAPPMVD